jgi:hypothetical protein
MDRVQSVADGANILYENVSRVKSDSVAND